MILESLDSTLPIALSTMWQDLFYFFAAVPFGHLHLSYWRFCKIVDKMIGLGLCDDMSALFFQHRLLRVRSDLKGQSIFQRHLSLIFALLTGIKRNNVHTYLVDLTWHCKKSRWQVAYLLHLQNPSGWLQKSRAILQDAPAFWRSTSKLTACLRGSWKSDILAGI